MLGLVARVSAQPSHGGDQGPPLALRWRDPETGEDLRTHAEEASARAAAERKRQLAEDARKLAEQERDEMARRNRELEEMMRRLRGGP